MKDYQIRALLRVVETGSIRAAARALQLSQPAVTKAIRELEAEVDAPLVLRGSRGVELTECGRQLAMRARLAHEQLSLALQDIRQLQGGKQATVAAAVTPQVFMGVLPDVLREFRRTLPFAQIKLYEGLLPMVLPQLREGFIDFAVAGAVEDALDPDLELEPIAQMDMVVVCRPGHPLCGATDWEQLVHAEWLVHRAPGSHHSVFFDELRRKGLPVPPLTVETNSFGVSWGLVTRSDLLLTVPASFLSIEPYARQVVRIALDMALPALTLGILKLRASPLSLAATKLATLFKRYAR